MGLLSDMLAGLGGVAKEVGGEIVEGFGDAVADVRNKVVMEPFFGRGDGATERVGDAMSTMGESIAAGVAEGNRGMLAEMAQEFAPPGSQAEQSMQPDIAPQAERDVEPER